MDETVRWPDCCLEGGCRDFALAVRDGFGSFGTPEALLFRLAERVSLRFPLFREGAGPN